MNWNFKGGAVLHKPKVYDEHSVCAHICVEYVFSSPSLLRHECHNSQTHRYNQICHICISSTFECSECWQGIEKNKTKQNSAQPSLWDAL